MEPRLYFIAHPPELSDDKFRRSGRVGGIVETDMHPCSDFARKERAIFVRPAADGDHIIPRFTEVFRDVVGRMTANVDPRFGHRLDCGFTLSAGSVPAEKTCEVGSNDCRKPCAI